MMGSSVTGHSELKLVQEGCGSRRLWNPARQRFRVPSLEFRIRVELKVCERACEVGEGYSCLRLESIENGWSELHRQPRGDRLFRLHTDNLIDELAVLENQHRGNAADVELRCGARIFVNVQFRNFVPAV